MYMYQICHAFRVRTIILDSTSWSITNVHFVVAEVCNTLGMTVWGVSRTQVPEEVRVPYIHHYR